MFKSTLLTTFFALLFPGIAHVDARVVVASSDDVIEKSAALTSRDVVSPPITYPTTGTVWNIGERHNCTWDTSVIPPGFKSNGMIVLGFLDDNEGDGEHLDLDHPLAKDFPITNGRAEITVPSVTTRNTYILVLFGDSGNASGKFTIKNISINQPPSSSSTSPSTTSSATSNSTGSTENTSTGSFNLGGLNGTSTISASSTSSALASGTPTASATSSAPISTSTSPSASGSAAADGAGPTTTTSTGAGTRSALFGGPTSWLSVCSFALVLGWVL